MNSKIRPNHTINGGVFQLTNTATSPKTLTSVTIEFSSPSLFSATQLVAELHARGATRSLRPFDRINLHSDKGSRSPAQDGGQVPPATGRRKRTGLSASSQSVVAATAGANVSGLPAALGQVVPK